MTKASIAPSDKGSATAKVMAELRKKPAGGRSPGRPKSEFKHSQHRGADGETASPSPDELKRALIRFDYWAEYHDAKNAKDRKSAFLDWVALDDPGIAGQAHALFSFHASKDGVIKVYQSDLAERSRESLKSIQRFSIRLEVGGFAKYKPGRKSGDKGKPSEYSITVPKTDRIEDAVWWTKLSTKPGGNQSSQQDKSVHQSDLPASQICPPESEVCWTDLSTTIDNEYITDGYLEYSDYKTLKCKGRVPLKGNPPPINCVSEFNESQGSKFAKRASEAGVISKTSSRDSDLAENPVDLDALRQAVAEAQIGLSNLEAPAARDRDSSFHDEPPPTAHLPSDEEIEVAEQHGHQFPRECDDDDWLTDPDWTVQ